MSGDPDAPRADADDDEDATDGSAAGAPDPEGPGSGGPERGDPESEGSKSDGPESGAPESDSAVTDDPGSDEDGDPVDYGWVMQVTFVATILIGAPLVAVLSVFFQLPTWESRVGFAARVGALVWFVTALVVYAYARWSR